MTANLTGLTTTELSGATTTETAERVPLTLDDIPEDLIITMTDIKNVGFCASGTRRWFTAHDLDFRDMVKNGISARALFATNDAYGIRVVESKVKSNG